MSDQFMEDVMENVGLSIYAGGSINLGNIYFDGDGSTPGDDTLTGTGRDDTISGGRGDDKISGRGGDDLLLGGLGADTLYGGRGDDTLKGGRGADVLKGGRGADVLKGGRGADVLQGGRGDDTLKGGRGADTLKGGAGDDFLDGGAGANTLTGNGGADTFVIGANSYNTITAFRLNQGDQLALDGGLKFEDLAISSNGYDTTIEVADTGAEIAIISGVDASTLTADAFTTVAAEKLSVSFDSIDLPDTIEFGDEGSVTLTLTNTSGHNFSGPAHVDLFISTDDDRDSISDERNDGLLNTLKVDVDLAPGESTTVVVDYENLTSVVAPGSYHLLAGIEGGELTSEKVAANGTDSVLAWHATALNAIQEFGEEDNDSTGIGIEPTVGSRGLAIVQTSVFNAVNAFSGEFNSYLDLDPGDPTAGASPDAAVAGAAVAALASVFPGTEDLSDSIVAQLKHTLDITEEDVGVLLTKAGLDDILEPPTQGAIFPEPFIGDITSPGGTPTYTGGLTSEIWEGFSLGVEAARQVLEARDGDGFTGFFNGIDDPATYDVPDDFVPFTDYIWLGDPLFDADSGDSVFGYDVNGDPIPFSLSPGWGDLTSFSGEYVGDFFGPTIDVNGDGNFLDGNPNGDPFEQALYVAEVNQVQTLGGLEDTAVTDVTRNQDQTEIAIFWAYDRADTFRPYGQLHQIAQEAAFRSGDDLVGNARTLALTSIALGDAAIAAWFEKYDEVQPRPQDVISGDGFIPLAAVDGFAGTVADEDWVPLLPDPPFPDFLSGHSTFAGAFSGVLDTLFPDATDIPVVSQEIVPGNGIFTTSDDELFDIDDFNAVRTFDSYGAIGTEDAISRLFGGVHVFEATLDAVNIGNEIGGFVANNLLAPVA